MAKRVEKATNDDHHHRKREKKHDEGHEYEYLEGFPGDFHSEALPGALPKGQNTPQQCPYKLYAEQLSGTSFTTPRVANQKTWLYRMEPTARHRPFKPSKKSWGGVASFEKAIINPNQLKWKPHPMPDKSSHVDFIDGFHTLGGCGSASTKTGYAIHIYICNQSMENSAMVNSDGDLLFVPQNGALDIRTELGRLYIEPGEIAVIQRGIPFSIGVEGDTRGYIAEVFNDHFRLPDLGPIGANGLANPRDFKVPTASFVQPTEGDKFTLYQKFLGELFECERDHNVFNVVAWHGNYVPFKYNLNDFCTVNSVSYDHLDPSIFTVLTCPSSSPGVATLDFVVFPPRWCVQEHTFRPPYYHRNTMTEFMGNIKGVYEAKPDGFPPGAATLHSCMVGHGPAAELYEKAIVAPLGPQFLFKDSLAFMFESTYPLLLTEWGNKGTDPDYYKVWEPLKIQFDGKQ